MKPQQIADYLEKYSIVSVEQLASHIEQLKRNTNPNLALISELVWALEDETSFFNSFSSKKEIPKHIKNYNLSEDYFNNLLKIYAGEIDVKTLKNKEGYKKADIFLDELFTGFSPKKEIKTENMSRLVEEELEKQINKPTYLKFTKLENETLTDKEQNILATRHKSKNGETHTNFSQVEPVKEVETITTTYGTGNPLFINYSGNTLEDYYKNSQQKIIDDWNRNDEGVKIKRHYKFPSDTNEVGIKEISGKTDYSEINLEILDLMAARFTDNKDKYPVGNMKKPIDIKSLEWALFRHIKKMIQPIDNDPEDYKQHLSAVLCNCSMIVDQLKIK